MVLHKPTWTIRVKRTESIEKFKSSRRKLTHTLIHLRTAYAKCGNNKNKKITIVKFVKNVTDSFQTVDTGPADTTNSCTTAVDLGSRIQQMQRFGDFSRPSQSPQEQRKILKFSPVDGLVSVPCIVMGVPVETRCHLNVIIIFKEYLFHHL
uniref:Uncharacterized protein n=1 Tax=Glossina austeni TaxID=7395 RepID=A0A1A9V7W6_GLOAU